MLEKTPVHFLISAMRGTTRQQTPQYAYLLTMTFSVRTQARRQKIILWAFVLKFVRSMEGLDPVFRFDTDACPWSERSKLAFEVRDER